MTRAAFAILAAMALAACGTPREEGEDTASPALCALPNVEAFDNFAKTPPQVAIDLLSRFRDVPTIDSAGRSELALALRGGFFNGSGTGSALLPNRRFVQALQRGKDVVVIYEHGGGPHLHVALYRQNESGVYHAFATVISGNNVHCETAARGLANPRDPVLWHSRIDW